MPTLQITLNSNDENIELIHDIGSQLMKLREVAVEWGVAINEDGSPKVPAGSNIGEPGCLIDLTDLGASTSEIVGYSPNVGATPHLYIPRPNPTLFNASLGAFNPVKSFYTMQPNLTFHTGDVLRSFHIRTFKDEDPMTLATYGATELRTITLYFEYRTNDINR